MLFTTIALAFCEVEICRPPRECSFTTFFYVFIHFFVVYYIIPSVSFDFLTCIINSLYTENNRRCLILSLDICCQYHFTSAVFFLVLSHNKWHGFSMWKCQNPKEEKRSFMPKWAICVKNVCNFESLDVFFFFFSPDFCTVSFCHGFLHTRGVALITKVKSVRQMCRTICSTAEVTHGQTEIRSVRWSLNPV